MAVWQFKIALIPKLWVDTGGAVLALFNAEGYEESSAAWVDFSNELLEERIGSLLPASKSWNSDLTCWGLDSTNDIQLWCEHGKVQSLTIRFDLRSPNMTLFAAVADEAQNLRLAVLDLGAKQIIGAELASLLRAAAESDAARFTLDPCAFLRKETEDANTT